MGEVFIEMARNTTIACFALVGYLLLSVQLSGVVAETDGLEEPSDAVEYYAPYSEHASEKHVKKEGQYEAKFAPTVEIAPAPVIEVDDTYTTAYEPYTYDDTTPEAEDEPLPQLAPFL